jgi:hypothetical protein
VPCIAINLAGDSWRCACRDAGRMGFPNPVKVHCLSLRDACRDAGGRATQEAEAGRAREREYL